MNLKQYGVILADPPWAYRVWNKKDAKRTAEAHYPTMSMEAIKALPVDSIAARDWARFLWFTFPVRRGGVGGDGCLGIFLLRQLPLCGSN